ncbi:MAG: hypothetical protein M3R24_14690 [Chloroflexota bacterium]|nr:hypothetical protein [Chloroflexota bacterium]
MMQTEVPSSGQQGETFVPQRALSLTMTTWRYLGDRSEADRAYCFRFGVSQAPEPVSVPGGAWAYPLPAV